MPRSGRLDMRHASNSRPRKDLFARASGRFAWCVVLGNVALSGCATFGSVRSAEVTPGFSFEAAATLATPPGNDAAWFWALGCAVACNTAVPGIDAALIYGDEIGRVLPFEVGVGLTGLNGYLYGYAQLGRGSFPFGVGGRFGMPAGTPTWRDDMAFARFDVVLSTRRRLLVVPTLLRHEGNSPNGANPGRFVAYAQGIGLETRTDRGWATPYVTIVFGRTSRERYGEVVADDARTVFGVLGFSYAFR